MNYLNDIYMKNLINYNNIQNIKQLSFLLNNF